MQSMSYEYRKGRIKFRREKRARLFTIAIIPETIGEPCRGGIMVEEVIMNGSQSPSGATFPNM